MSVSSLWKPHFDPYVTRITDRALVVFLALQDGSSWSRYLTSRLIPSHKDPVEDQIKGFPGLAELSEAELERLRSRFLPTDDESFREFFWDVCTSSSSAW